MTIDGALGGPERIVIALLLASLSIHALDQLADRVIDWRRRWRGRGP